MNQVISATNKNTEIGHKLPVYMYIVCLCVRVLYGLRVRMCVGM